MATRSRIGIINKGEVVADTVYCHWDGSPQYVGWILKLYYNNPERLKNLFLAETFPLSASSLARSMTLTSEMNMKIGALITSVTVEKMVQTHNGCPLLNSGKIAEKSIIICLKQKLVNGIIETILLIVGGFYLTIFAALPKRTKNRQNRKSQSTTKRISIRILTRCLMTSLLNSKN